MLNALSTSKAQSPADTQNFFELLSRSGINPEEISWLESLEIPVHLRHSSLDFVKQAYFQRFSGGTIRYRPYKKVAKNYDYDLFGTYYSCLGCFDIVDFLKDRMRSQKAVHWLDICCGEMTAVREVMRNFMFSPAYATGLDIQDYGFKPNSIERLSGKIRFVQQEAQNLSLDERFDLITSVCGITYLPDKLRAIENWYSHLSDSGLMILNIPQEDIWQLRGKRKEDFEAILSGVSELDYCYTSGHNLQSGSSSKIVLSIRKTETPLRFNLSLCDVAYHIEGYYMRTYGQCKSVYRKKPESP